MSQKEIVFPKVNKNPGTDPLSFTGRYPWSGDALDITGAGNVEVLIRNDGKVVWVNIDGMCALRICQITGKITYGKT